jgi:hypothetical protein
MKNAEMLKRGKTEITAGQRFSGILGICAPALMPATLAALPPIRRIPDPAYSDL